jgi:hypothetical protein
MENEILKKLDSINEKVGSLENRLGRVEALSVATSQKIVSMNTSAAVSGQAPIQRTVVAPPSEVMPTVLTELTEVTPEPVITYDSQPSTMISYLPISVGLIFANLAAILGFILPYFFGYSAFSDFGYFVYTLTLNFVILAVAYYKKWSEITFVGFVGTILHFISWHALSYTPDKFGIAVYALIVFFFIYLATSLINKFTLRENTDEMDLLMLTLNPFWFFFELFYLLQAGNDTLLSLVAVGIGALYIGLALFFRLFKRDNPMFALFLGSISAIFFTLAVPLMFENNSITIVWAVGSVLIAVIGAMTNNEGMKVASLAIFSAAVIRFFALDTFNSLSDLQSWIPIFNRAFFTYLILIFTGTIIAYFFGHLMGEEYRSDKRLIAAIWLVVNLLALTSFVGEITRYYDKVSFDLDNKIAEEVKLITLEDQLRQLSQNGAPIQYIDPYVRVNAVARSTSINNQKKVAVSAVILGALIFSASYIYIRRPKRA